jgi:hypothetical protein
MDLEGVHETIDRGTLSHEEDVAVIVLPPSDLRRTDTPTKFGDHLAVTSTNACPVRLLHLKVANVVAFSMTILLNYTSSAGYISPYGVGTVSRMNPTKISPASGAFAIWLYIYVLQAFFVVYQFVWPKKDEALLLHGVGLWYIGACICNSLWIITFVQGNTAALWCSMVIIFGLLACICKVYMNTYCWAKSRPGGVLQFFAVDVHFSLYGGWVTVASIVNSAIAINSIVDADSSTESTCSVVMLLVALLLNTTLAVTRQDCVWPGVLAWASGFIHAAHQEDTAVSSCALVVCILSGVVSAGVGLYTIIMLARGRDATKSGGDVDMGQNESHVSTKSIGR